MRDGAADVIERRNRTPPEGRNNRRKQRPTTHSVYPERAEIHVGARAFSARDPSAHSIIFKRSGSFGSAHSKGENRTAARQDLFCTSSAFPESKRWTVSPNCSLEVGIGLMASPGF